MDLKIESRGGRRSIPWRMRLGNYHVDYLEDQESNAAESTPQGALFCESISMPNRFAKDLIQERRRSDATMLDALDALMHRINGKQTVDHPSYCNLLSNVNKLKHLPYRCCKVLRIFPLQNLAHSTVDSKIECASTPKLIAATW